MLVRLKGRNIGSAFTDTADLFDLPPAVAEEGDRSLLLGEAGPGTARMRVEISGEFVLATGEEIRVLVCDCNSRSAEYNLLCAAFRSSSIVERVLWMRTLSI